MITVQRNMTDALPIIQTKLHQPPLPRGLVARPRLTDLLDRQPKCPLTLVSAPAGYGKSTLIASWAEASDLPVAWVSLDEHDSDIVIFISYLLAALQSVYPDAGANTSALFQSPEIPTTRLIFNTLMSEIHHIGEPLVFVLDDYHLVRSASIQDFIEKLLTHPSRHLHLVISTRVDPPLSLSKFRARNQMTEVRLQDLRFTEDEVALLLEKIIGNSVDSKTSKSTR